MRSRVPRTDDARRQRSRRKTDLDTNGRFTRHVSVFPRLACFFFPSRACHHTGKLRVPRPPLTNSLPNSLTNHPATTVASSMSAYTLSTIAAWYFSNIGVILLNKYLLSVWGFKFPIFLTMCHMVMCLVLAAATRSLGFVPRQNLKSRRHLLKIAVLAVVFVASVVGGNVSLRFIPVSFNQAIGATTPFFTALLSLFIMRQKETPEVYVTLVPIVLGIVLASKAEPLFHLTGFIACVSATFARALKSVLQGLLLTNETEKLDSLNLLLFMSPVALLVLVSAVTVMEPDAFGVFAENCVSSPKFFCIMYVCRAFPNPPHNVSSAPL